MRISFPLAMILLVAPSHQALPPITVQTDTRCMVLPRRRATAEAQVKKALDSGRHDLLLSVGFAAAADRTLVPGDLLLATRVFGGADVYYDLPPLQAPGAVRGSLCTLLPEDKERPARAPDKRLPPVYAFDDHGFWLAKA